MKCITQEGWEVASDVKLAISFGKRLKGLLGRDGLAKGEGLLLRPCPQIHTFFMRFAIDVVFLDKDNEVLYVIENLPPWRLSPIVARAAQTLELSAGALRGRLKVGTKLTFIQ